MFAQTLKESILPFKLFICILLLRYHSAAPVNSSESYDTFIEEIIQNDCHFPTAVILPFSSKATFEYLATPLKICKNPKIILRSREAIHLCNEIFDTLKNVTCHSYTQLPKIEVSFSENVCKDIKSLKFEEGKESLLRHLTDSFVCDLMCDTEFKPACTVLLWSYEVLRQIEDAENNLKVGENKDAQTTANKTSILPENTVEQTKQIRIALTNGNSQQTKLDNENTQNELVNENTQNQLVNENTQKAQDTDNTIKDEAADVKNEAIPVETSNAKLKKQDNLNIEASKPVDSNMKQDQSTLNLEQNILNEGEKTNNQNMDLTNNQNEEKQTNHQVAEETNIQNVGKETNHQTVNEDTNELAHITKQNSDVHDSTKTTDNGGEGPGNENKNMEENELTLKGISPKENELTKVINGKIPPVPKESGSSNKENPKMNNVNNEAKEQNLSPNHSTVSLPETGEKMSDVPTKPVSPESKTSVSLKSVDNKTTVDAPKEKLNTKSKNTVAKTVTVPEVSSLQTENPVAQLKPTQPKKIEISKDVQTVETASEISPPTTIADLEKMEDGNEIPEPKNKDQESYNGDDGFFEPPKSKQTEETDTAKLPDSVIESQNDMSRYQIFPAKFGQSNGNQIISQFPEQEDSHFFFYFLSIVLILMGGYLLFHNKQKIIALIVEGRHERRRRSHGVGYKKLDTK